MACTSVLRSCVILLVVANVSRGQPGQHVPGNLLFNGSFEQGPDPGPFAVYSKGSSDIPGWQVTQATVDYVGTHWPASEGKRSIDLDGSPGAGAIQTTFPTTPGQRYEISFDLAGNSQCEQAIKKLRVNVGAAVREFEFNATGLSAGTGWVRRSFEFVARAPTTTLQFTSLDAPDSECGPILDNVAAVATGGSEKLGTLAGAWFGPDGVTHYVEQSGTTVSWRIGNTAWVFHGEVQGREVKASSESNGTAIPFDEIRGTLNLAGLNIRVREYLHGGLVGESTLVRFSSAQDKPDKLGILVEKPSTLAGQRIAAQLILENEKGLAVLAERDYQVELKANNKAAILDPPHVVMRAGSPSALFTITANQPGETMIAAQSDPPLAPTQRSVYSCLTGVISALEFSSGAHQGPADGETPIGFTLKLTDGNGHLTTDQKPNSVTFQRKGVGTVDRNDTTLPSDQCIAELDIASADPGSATVLGQHGSQTASADFFFTLPLTMLVFMSVVAGGLGGYLIRLSAEYSRHRRRRTRFSVDMLAAILSGTAVFLAYYYGLLQVAPRLVGGKALCFLLGLVGGYLGPAALDRISHSVVPGQDKSVKAAQRKGPKTSS